MGALGIRIDSIPWPEDTCRFSPHVNIASAPSDKEEGLSPSQDLDRMDTSPPSRMGFEWADIILSDEEDVR